jgi:ketosteroid isomerase-like protein
MDAAAARAFAEEWIGAWNSHDLERIVAHYAPEIVFLSPQAEKRVGNGRVAGIAALRSYWGSALADQPGLAFELVDVLTGFDCVTIFYRNHRGQQVAETCEFGSQHQVIRSYACYSK